MPGQQKLTLYQGLISFKFLGFFLPLGLRTLLVGQALLTLLIWPRPKVQVWLALLKAQANVAYHVALPPLLASLSFNLRTYNNKDISSLRGRFCLHIARLWRLPASNAAQREPSLFTISLARNPLLLSAIAAWCKKRDLMLCVRVVRLLYAMDGEFLMSPACDLPYDGSTAFNLSVSNNAPLPYSPLWLCVSASLSRSSTTVCLSVFVCVRVCYAFCCPRVLILIEKPFLPDQVSALSALAHMC
jgi:hypothetical protein